MFLAALGLRGGVGSSLWCESFSSCDPQAPDHVGSVPIPGLYCSVVCGILVPHPGIESASYALEGIFSTIRPTGKSL